MVNKPANNTPPHGPATNAFDVLDSLSPAVLLVEHGGAIVYRNRPARELFPQHSSLDSIIRELRFNGPYENWQDLISKFAKMPEPTPLSFVATITGTDLEQNLPVLVRCSPFRSEHDACRGATLIEISKFSNLVSPNENQRAATLARLGERAAKGIHEWNNALDGTLRYINLALRHLDAAGDPKLREFLSESKVGLMRVTQSIRELLNHARAADKGSIEREVNDVVEEVVRAWSPAAEEHKIVVTVDFQKRTMPKLNSTRLFRVCSNLIKNAIEAMSSGGRLSITTGLLGTEVVIQVADTGHGLPDPPERVFEPFFTTKPPGCGTGLGLAICKETVEELGGSITAVRDVQGGSVFTVRLPASTSKRNLPPTSSNPLQSIACRADELTKQK